MSQKHSPEPWKVEPEPKDYRVTIESQGVVVLDCLGHNDKETDVANAARIVACVNFCAGLTNEQLVDKDMLPWQILIEERDQSIKEIARLKADLIKLAKFTEHAPYCRELWTKPEQCTCGLAQLLEGTK